MKKFLLVDDNDFSLSLTKELIGEACENREISFVLAKDGMEAVDIFANSKADEFSAIFMDIVMPEKTGVTVLHEIRSMQRSDAKVVPIVIVSALSEENSMEGLEDRELITDYIQKPLTVEKFKNTLAKIQG